MANIALLNRCNLRCPYCFADSYTAEEKEDITMPTFARLLDFCAEERQVGIIGGEPFLHKNALAFLEMLRMDPRFDRVTVFTNGIFIDKAIDLLACGKFHTLINVNAKSDVGDTNYERTAANVHRLIERAGRRSLTLGINVYRENQDFSDFLALVRDTGVRKVRVSLVIPQNRAEGGIPYFLRMKPTLLALYGELKALGVAPCYDCNAIPACVYTEEERAFLATLPYENDHERRILMGEASVCSPVIDLYPDMTATRCFGMYDACRVPIRDFACLSDLRNYFFKEVDCRLVNTPACSDCEACYKYKTFGCFGGCLCYKQSY